MKNIWLKHYPSSIPSEIPPLDQSLIQRFEESCTEFKDQTAFISFNKTMSYSELKKKSYQLSAFFQSQGFKKGDRMAIQLPNLLQQPLSLWACFLSGLTVVNLSPLYTAREMKKPLKESQAKGIVLLSSHLKNLEGLIEESPIELVLVTEPGDLLDFPKKQFFNLLFKYKHASYAKTKKHFSFLNALKQGAKTKLQIQERDLKDTVLIQYTGGTTGFSKGVCLSQKNILSNIKQCEIWMLKDLQRGKEKALAALPLFHIFAFVVNGMVFFLNGFSNLLIANPKQSSSLIHGLKKHPVTIGTGVNTLFKNLLKHKRFQNLQFKNWKVFVAGGMALHPDIEKLWTSLTKSRLIEGYGLTETSPVVSCNLLDKTRPGFAGFPLPSTEVRIVDEKNKELDIEQEGELEVCGPQVMKGYYKNPEETKKILSKTGWLKTGDIAKINKEGLIQILGRKKDMINISGLKVYPDEVEEVLLRHHEIQEALVVPFFNKEGEEEVKAFLIKKKDGLKQGEVQSHCKKYLAGYKIPKHIEWTQEIKKSFLGKPINRFKK